MLTGRTQRIAWLLQRWACVKPDWLAHMPNAGREPLLYAMVLLLSLQLRGCVAFLASDASTRAFRVDAVHLALALHASHLLDSPTEGALVRQTLRDGLGSVSLLRLHPVSGPAIVSVHPTAIIPGTQ